MLGIDEGYLTRFDGVRVAPTYIQQIFKGSVL